MTESFELRDDLLVKEFSDETLLCHKESGKACLLKKEGCRLLEKLKFGGKSDVNLEIVKELEENGFFDSRRDFLAGGAKLAAASSFLTILALPEPVSAGSDGTATLTHEITPNIVFPLGGTVTHRITLTNLGPGNITSPVVTVTPPTSGPGSFPPVIPILASGDNGNGILEPGEVWIYLSPATYQPSMIPGTTEAIFTASATCAADLQTSLFFNG